MGFPGGSVVKNPPANASDMCLIPGWEGPMEKRMATHSSVLAWDIHRHGSLVVYSPWSHKRVRCDLLTEKQQQSVYMFIMI